MFPTVEEGSFTLEIARANITVAALAMGLSVAVLEEWDRLPFDPASITYQDMCMLLSRKALSRDSGKVGTGWAHLLLYHVVMNYNGPGEWRTGTNEAAHNYDVTFNRSTKTPWGETVSEASGEEFFTGGKLTMHTFLGDNSDDEAILEYVPVSSTLNDRISVFADGVKETTGITIVGSEVTWGAAPGSAERDVIIYEHI